MKDVTVVLTYKPWQVIVVGCIAAFAAGIWIGTIIGIVAS